MSKVVAFPTQLDADANDWLVAIIESSNDAIVSKDLNSIIRSWNSGAERLFGYPADEAIGQSVLMLIPDNLHDEEVDIIRRIRSGERIGSYETRRVRKDGTLIAVSLTISPVRNKAGDIVGASKIARDITAAKENERRIRVLLREVNHRTKNQFSVILAMIGETRRKSASPEEFEERIRDRITALSKSHDLLVTTDWVGASLFNLIEEHLKPFGHEEQITLSGPLIVLQPSSVQHLGMAIHELGTNAAKYGALSNDAGRLTVTWRLVHPIEGEPTFELEWFEETAVYGSPDSGRKGFGTVVLQRITPASLNGTAAIERSPGRTLWKLSAPASSVANMVDPLAE